MQEKILSFNYAEEAQDLAVQLKRESNIRQWIVSTGVILGCWTFLALLFAPQTYILNLHSSPPLTWWQALQANLVLFYVWAALTPLVLWLGNKFSLERTYLGRNLTIHFGLSFLVAALQLVVLQVINSFTKLG